MIDGIITNMDILYLIMHSTHFVRGVYDTNFVKDFLDSIKDKFNE